MSWNKPTSHTANGWADPTNAYNGNTVDYALYSPGGKSWSPYLELSIGAVDCDKARVYSGRSAVQISDIQVDVYYDAVWNNIYNGALTVDEYVEYPIGSTQSVSGMRVRYYNSHNSQTRDVYVHDTDFWEVEASTTYYQNAGGATVTPTGANIRQTIKSIGGAITPSGALDAMAIFLTTVGQATITPISSLTKVTTKDTGGATITPAKDLSKQTAKDTGGATIPPTGDMTEQFSVTQEVGGGTITPTGGLVKMVIKLVGGTITPAGVIVKAIGKKVGNATITPAGNAVKSTTKTVGGAILIPIGTLVKGVRRFINVGGGVITPNGLLSTEKTTGEGVTDLRLKVNKMFQSLKNLIGK